MPRELDARPWFAWFPVVTEDGGWAWLRRIWCRKEFLGRRTARLGDCDLLIWHYYKSEPPPLYR